MMLSLIPSLRYSVPGSAPTLTNGNTASESIPESRVKNTIAAVATRIRPATSSPAVRQLRRTPATRYSALEGAAGAGDGTADVLPLDGRSTGPAGDMAGTAAVAAGRLPIAFAPTEIRLESASRRRRFKSVRISAAD